MSNPMQLRPGEWKQNVLFNLASIQNYVLSIPDTNESGVAALTPEHITVIEQEMERTRLFLQAWRRSRFEAAQPADVQTARNGASAPQARKKGGWPKGKSRKAKAAEAEVPQ